MYAVLACVFALLLTSFPAVFAQEYHDLGVRIETVVEDLDVPWAIAWLPDGTVLFTERPGHLRALYDGILLPEPLLSLNVGDHEGGLLGIAVDPDYSDNDYIYLYYTSSGFFTNTNKVVRYVYEDGKVSESATVIDDIPGGPFHDGGRIKFGPDGKLYITTGDAGSSHLSQDETSLAGKILRVNSDGTIPRDNPFGGSAVYSLGHRNPQGLDWDMHGNLLVTDHGPSGERGRAHDEINLVVSGANYGWPEVTGSQTRAGLVEPVLHTGNQTWAPSGAVFYNSELIPEWTGKYFVATLRGSHLHMIDFDGTEILSHQKLFEGDFGRIRDVALGPDGALYLLTSNQDGRGMPKAGDDRILRILPITSDMACSDDSHAIWRHDGQCIPSTIPLVEFGGGQSCSMVSDSNPIHVTTDMNHYDVSGVLRVEGCLGDIEYSNVNITIYDPQGNNVIERSIPVNQDGIFTAEFVLDGETFSTDGAYTVESSAGGLYHSTKTFTVPEFSTLMYVFASCLSGILIFYKLSGRLNLANTLSR